MLIPIPIAMTVAPFWAQALVAERTTFESLDSPSVKTKQTLK